VPPEQQQLQDCKWPRRLQTGTLLSRGNVRLCAMTQVVSHRPLVKQVWIPSQVSPCGICGGYSGTKKGSAAQTPVFPCHCHSTNATYSFIYLAPRLHNLTYLLVLLFVLVVGPISTAAMKAYFTLTLMEFHHSSPEALHTKRCERPLLAKDRTKAKEFS
jgi:hypothetical protein